MEGQKVGWMSWFGKPGGRVDALGWGSESRVHDLEWVVRK